MREGSEECDDGNTISGDCCSATCQAEAAGTPCAADGNVCTDDVCDGAGSCGVPNTAACDDGNACTGPDVCSGGSCGGPAVSCNDFNLCTQDSCNPLSGCANLGQPRAGCHSPGRSLLLLKQNADDDAKDKLVWKWLKGTTTASEFGNPSATADYALCVYAGSTPTPLTAPLDLPASPSTWSPIGTIGWSYFDTANADGVQTGTLKSSLAGKAKIILKGKGASLPDPTLPPATPLVVQLVNDGPGACWEASYGAGDVLKATAAVFKAKR